jgi:hypothetical protein
MSADILRPLPRLLQEAIDTIKQQYGDSVSPSLEYVHKFGEHVDIDTNEEDITWNGGTEARPTTNTIDSLSSNNAGDTNKPIYLEGCSISGNVLTWVTQVVNTDAANGQTRVELPTPMARVHRMRGATTGEVYAYENTALTGGKPTDTTKIKCTCIGGDNTSLEAKLAVPSDRYFILTRYWATLGRSGGSNAADIRFKIATLGDAVLGNNFRTDEKWGISLNAPLNKPSEPYEIIKPNTDLMMTGVTTDASGIDIKAGFHGYWAKITNGRLSTLGPNGYEINK